MKGAIWKREDLPRLIKAVLSRRKPKLLEDKDAAYRHGAVLIPLFWEAGEYKVLFTKRTDTVEAHRGQISFPGGRIDEEDCSLLDTALRETEEEIGLPRHVVTILGRSDDARTLSSNYIVHAFVGLIPYPFPFRLNAGEVKKLVEVPFSLFLDVEEIIPVEYEGKIYQNLAYNYDGEVVWGATARIIRNLVEILLSSLGNSALINEDGCYCGK
jgi:8-oxo-dGTP pyrophosphatase MutT (NUDIX family)